MIAHTRRWILLTQHLRRQFKPRSNERSGGRVLSRWCCRTFIFAVEQLFRRIKNSARQAHRKSSAERCRMSKRRTVKRQISVRKICVHTHSGAIYPDFFRTCRFIETSRSSDLRNQPFVPSSLTRPTLLLVRRWFRSNVGTNSHTAIIDFEFGGSPRTQKLWPRVCFTRASEIDKPVRTSQ